jgi:hypothetical protein
MFFGSGIFDDERTMENRILSSLEFQEHFKNIFLAIDGKIVRALL